jgi:hypothetical protein
MLTVATAAAAAAAAAIVVLLHHQHVATAFYLPGVKPHDYRRGEVYVIPMVGCCGFELVRSEPILCFCGKVLTEPILCFCGKVLMKQFFNSNTGPVVVIVALSFVLLMTRVKLKVNKMTSTKTLLPIEYYRVPFCLPVEGVNDGQ